MVVEHLTRVSTMSPARTLEEDKYEDNYVVGGIRTNDTRMLVT